MRVKGKYIFETCTTVYKAANGLYPEWYLNVSTVRENTGGITKQNDYLFLPKTATDSGVTATATCGPKAWNE